MKRFPPVSATPRTVSGWINNTSERASKARSHEERRREVREETHTEASKGRQRRRCEGEKYSGLMRTVAGVTHVELAQRAICPTTRSTVARASLASVSECSFSASFPPIVAVCHCAAATVVLRCSAVRHELPSNLPASFVRIHQRKHW